MPHLTSSDGALVLLTLAGDPTAYDELILRNEKKVRAAAYSVIRNAHIAEDSAQDAFLAAWLKLDRLKDPEKFGAWVSRIAKNCAKNMALRFRNYLSLEETEGLEYIPSGETDPEQLLMTEDEAELMRRGLRKLPERSQQVIYLHYYEDMSAEQIAGLMGISVGTVKSQLHDGRLKMRKELCAMDEKLNDTLLQKIRKKIKEVKDWQYKNSKSGFEKVYKSVLKDIDAMPECAEKYSALADVLIRGYWWLPEETNDGLFKRIKEAARLGKNNEVMCAVLERESLKFWGNARLDHIKNVQIPSLDPVDFRLTIADRWLAAASAADLKNPDEALNAIDSALKILNPDNALYYYAINKKKCFEDSLSEEFLNDQQNRINSASAYELSLSDGIKIVNNYYCNLGQLYSYSWRSGCILENLFMCDGMMTAKIGPGESVSCSDGSTLTFESDSAEITVPAGKFGGCEVWVSRLKDAAYRSWFKSGVGLIMQELVSYGISEKKLLESYKIVGGSGLMPIHRGNAWVYSADGNPEAYAAPTTVSVEYCKGERAVMTVNTRAVRKKYDENSWLDMILKTRSDYVVNHGEEDNEAVSDVRRYARRACELAKTPYEKAFSEAVCSVVTRIIETDQNLNPGCEAVGLWNFFNCFRANNSDGRVCLGEGNRRYGFEWKNYDGTSLGKRVLSNHIYSILSDVAGCLFDDRWKPGFSTEDVRSYYGDPIKIKITCEDAGSVAVKAGAFENCLSVDTLCDGMSSSHAYRGGRRTYFFAPGVGLVKVDIYRSGLKSSYELTDYTGTGSGYMPINDGMTRRYEDLGLTDGYVGAVKYIYSKDCDGNTVIFSDAIGIRKSITKITRYSSIFGETEESRLVLAGKYDEANLEGNCNAVHALLHQITKIYHFFMNPNARARRCLYNIRLMEAAGNGEVYPALYQAAAKMELWAAVAFIGGNEREKGYECLEKALDYAEKWKNFPDGEKLSFGDESVFGKVVYIKGQSVIELPDGSRREIDADGNIDGFDSGMIYYAMTADSGWEWFDPAREDERFKKLTERARRIAG